MVYTSLNFFKFNLNYKIDEIDKAWNEVDHFPLWSPPPNTKHCIAMASYWGGVPNIPLEFFFSNFKEMSYWFLNPYYIYGI